eukprot:9135071-Pyramimonas_sp.AAC.1
MAPNDRWQGRGRGYTTRANQQHGQPGRGWRELADSTYSWGSRPQGVWDEHGHSGQQGSYDNHQGSWGNQTSSWDNQQGSWGNQESAWSNQHGNERGAWSQQQGVAHGYSGQQGSYGYSGQQSSWDNQQQGSWGDQESAWNQHGNQGGAWSQQQGSWANQESAWGGSWDPQSANTRMHPYASNTSTGHRQMQSNEDIGRAWGNRAESGPSSSSRQSELPHRPEPGQWSAYRRLEGQPESFILPDT